MNLYTKRDSKLSFKVQEVLTKFGWTKTKEFITGDNPDLLLTIKSLFQTSICSFYYVYLYFTIVLRCRTWLQGFGTLHLKSSWIKNRKTGSQTLADDCIQRIARFPLARRWLTLSSNKDPSKLWYNPIAKPTARTSSLEYYNNKRSECKGQLTISAYIRDVVENYPIATSVCNWKLILCVACLRSPQLKQLMLDGC